MISCRGAHQPAASATVTAAPSAVSPEGTAAAPTPGIGFPPGVYTNFGVGHVDDGNGGLRYHSTKTELTVEAGGAWRLTVTDFMAGDAAVFDRVGTGPLPQAALLAVLAPAAAWGRREQPAVAAAGGGGG